MDSRQRILEVAISSASRNWAYVRSEKTLDREAGGSQLVHEIALCLFRELNTWVHVELDAYRQDSSDDDKHNTVVKLTACRAAVQYLALAGLLWYIHTDFQVKKVSTAYPLVPIGKWWISKVPTLKTQLFVAAGVVAGDYLLNHQAISNPKLARYTSDTERLYRVTIAWLVVFIQTTAIATHLTTVIFGRGRACFESLAALVPYAVTTAIWGMPLLPAEALGDVPSWEELNKIGRAEVDKDIATVTQMMNEARSATIRRRAERFHNTYWIQKGDFDQLSEEGKRFIRALSSVGYRRWCKAPLESLWKIKTFSTEEQAVIAESLPGYGRDGKTTLLYLFAGVLDSLDGDGKGVMGYLKQWFDEQARLYGKWLQIDNMREETLAFIRKWSVDTWHPLSGEPLFPWNPITQERFETMKQLSLSAR